MKRPLLLLCLFLCCFVCFAGGKKPADTGSDYPGSVFAQKSHDGRYVKTIGAAFTSGPDVRLFSLQTIHGYRFNPWFFLGAGTGVSLTYLPEFYKTSCYATGFCDADAYRYAPRAFGCSVPLFAHARINFLPDNKGRGVPFIALNGGNNFYLGGEVKIRGVMYEALAGYGLNFGLKHFFNLMAGYSSVRWNPDSGDYGARTNAFIVKLDFSW